ncbi:hypothetical protein M0805_000607 [Coniferiporia weirii]|nr:hypothetical protein M0805_000607 [Coniferiporia weirii]
MHTPKISVRPASIADSTSIARICLLTTNQGRSAEALVQHPELPSQVRALPYLYLPSGFGFVLVETMEVEKQERKQVVGYVVGTARTTQFEREVAAMWRPFLRTKYPRNLTGTPLDRYFVDLIYKIPRIAAQTVQFHVNVLDRYKEYGYDHLLVDVALNHFRVQRVTDGV